MTTMQIGDFAAMTGLSVKALRHYDDLGLLTPAAIDHATGYRRYHPSQARTAEMIRLLRDGDVALPDIARVLAGELGADDALAARRAAVLAARAEEDDRFGDAQLALARSHDAVEIHERDAPEQGFLRVRRHLRLSGLLDADDADNAAEARQEEAFQQLMAATALAGERTDGMFWTAMTATGRDSMVLDLCTGTARPDADGGPAAPSVAGPGIIEWGVLPARRELVATWATDSSKVVPMRAIHPAAVALLDAADERGIDLGQGVELRQLPRFDAMGTGTVEVIVTIPDDSAMVHG